MSQNALYLSILLCSFKTQHLKSLFGVDIVYLQQLQQVISNVRGGPQLLTQGSVYAYRAASQIGGTFPPQWGEPRENLKLFMIFTIIGWLFSHTGHTTLFTLNTL